MIFMVNVGFLCISAGNRFGQFVPTFVSTSSGSPKRELTKPVSAYYNEIIPLFQD
jgi:hypothetical protein